ncbi:hypothetical protein Pelo_15377 [Pelomyxa schiedti]|nr:hypothetical protein Pelo_15377 [Pelomyxa schiedti]
MGSTATKEPTGKPEPSSPSPAPPFTTATGGGTTWCSVCHETYCPTADLANRETDLFRPVAPACPTTGRPVLEPPDPAPQVPQTRGRYFDSDTYEAQEL